MIFLNILFQLVKNKNKTLGEVGPEKVQKFYDWTQAQPDFNVKHKTFVSAMEAYLDENVQGVQRAT